MPSEPQSESVPATERSEPEVIARRFRAMAREVDDLRDRIRCISAEDVRTGKPLSVPAGINRSAGAASEHLDALASLVRGHFGRATGGR